MKEDSVKVKEERKEEAEEPTMKDGKEKKVYDEGSSSRRVNKEGVVTSFATMRRIIRGKM